MSTLTEKLYAAGEPCAAGLLETPERGLFYRKALALCRYYEHCPLPEYHGELLYPSGTVGKGIAVRPAYITGFSMNRALMEKKVPEFPLDEVGRTFFGYTSVVPEEHTVAGNMYTHSMPDSARICAEGLDSYRERIEKIEDRDMREGLLCLLDGIACLRKRCEAYLRSCGAPEVLTDAVSRVPMQPCTNIYDAVECWNFVLYLDNCDNLGALGVGLAPFWKGEDIVPLLENLYDNLDICGGYSMSLGTDPAMPMGKGSLTEQCLRACKGKRRPMIELFTDAGDPPELWDAAMDCVMSGGGQPAFYNRRLYKEGFSARFPQIDPKDLDRLCGGGCTEMTLAGLSSVGSLDAGVNLLLIFEQVMYRDLPGCPDFESFYRAYMDEAHAQTLKVLEAVAESQKIRAEADPLPMRSLLVTGCIESGKDFNNGGARYSWSVVNLAGIVNVIDSLLAVRDTVFLRHEMSAGAFLERMRENDAGFLKHLREKCTCFGVDDPDANALGRRFTETLFGWLEERTTYYGLGFLPSSIQFLSYTAAGRPIGATPCGRAAGEPIDDSLTAVFRKDTKGPTALLKSVTSLALYRALGTPVMNFTVNPGCGKDVLGGLVRSYLDLGGMQMQVTCTSREELERAYADPESYPNLIVRVGGYSEYFVRLEDALRRKVLERTYYL